MASGEREPILLVICQSAALEDWLRQRYAAGYRVLVLDPYHADPFGACEAQRNGSEQVAMLIFEPGTAGEQGIAFLEEGQQRYPDARRLLILETADAIQSHPAVDWILTHPLTPVESKLYPVIDELLAEWRASVGTPSMQVSSIMTMRAVRIRITDSLHRAAEIIALSSVGDLMVIDHNNTFVGVLSVGDVLRAAMPDVDEIMSEGGTLDQAFRLFLRKGSELMYKPVEPLVIRNPLVVDPEDHVAKVAALMLEKNIHRLPVVKDGRLLGTVGRTDICQAVVGTL